MVCDKQAIHHPGQGRKDVANTGQASSINVRKVLWTCAELTSRSGWRSGDPASNPRTPRRFWRSTPMPWCPSFRMRILRCGSRDTIIRYLATRHGANALYPAEARARARVDQWIDWRASDLNTAWRYAFLSLVSAPPASRPSGPSRSLPAVVSLHEILERQLQTTGGYVAGPHFSLADIPIGLSVNQLAWRRPMIARRYPPWTTTTSD